MGAAAADAEGVAHGGGVMVAAAAHAGVGVSDGVVEVEVLELLEDVEVVEVAERRLRREEL
jgi:hypothetical protein